jgi:hypothetical protein
MLVGSKVARHRGRRLSCKQSYYEGSIRVRQSFIGGEQR